MRINCETDGTDTTAQGAAHGRRDVSDVDRVPGGPVGLAGGSGGRPGVAAGGHASSRVHASVGLVEHPGEPLDDLAGPGDGLAALGGGRDGGSVAVLGQPGASGGPRGAAVLAAVGDFMRRGKAARPGRAKRRGRRGVRCGPQTVKCAPDSAPPAALLPGFTRDSMGCSSPRGTTARIEGQQGRAGAGQGGGTRC